MRLLTDNSNTEINDLTLVLTKAEIREFIGYLEQLLEGEHHCHLSDGEFIREITMCMYAPERMEEYDQRVQEAFASIQNSAQ
ncbi:MAG TPA: hypothetical protein VK171_02595 [Fimbriimonas sp.]|nr:hypothetical protein [Fimbriimonas sp.]